MSSTHTVIQGEYLAGIAEQYDFPSPKAIWEHPQNAELKKLRKNPNILFPGDVVFIPDLEAKDISVRSDKKHTFVLTVPTLMLQVVIHDVDDKPLKGALYVLSLRSKNRDGTADRAGMTVDPLEPGEETANLWLPEPDLRLRLMIGYLNPLVEKPSTEEEIAGWQARLYNLDYFAGFAATNVKQLKWAVEEFQRDDGCGCGPGGADRPYARRVPKNSARAKNIRAMLTRKWKWKACCGGAFRLRRYPAGPVAQVV